MRRELHALILALAGGALLKITVTGAYTQYVKAGLRPYLVAAAAVLLAVAVCSLWQGAGAARLLRRVSPQNDPPRHDGHSAADHAHGRFDVAWLLAVPMLAVLLIAPPALSSFSAGRSGTALGTAPTSDIPPLPAGDPVRVSVLDYASRAVFDHGRTLQGRTIRLSGFVVANGTSGWYLTRMIITCCAADAQPVKVGLSGAVPAGLHPNDWIETTGTYSSHAAKDPVNGEPIPYLDVTAAKAIPAPEQQYVS